MKNDLIVWDESSVVFSDNDKFNMMFLQHLDVYTNELINNKGYVYLNSIYEMLGINWNAERENICFRSHINFNTERTSNGFSVNITELEESA